MGGTGGMSRADGREAEAARTSLRKLLESVDPSDRLVALLHWADGLTAGEIGILLDRSEQEIARRITGVRTAARAALRGGALASA